MMSEDLSPFYELQFSAEEITGKIKLSQLNNISVPVTFSLEDDEGETVPIDHQSMLTFSQQRIALLTPQRLDEIIYAAAHEITAAAYENVVPESDLQALITDMHLKELVFFNHDFLIVFASPNIFRDQDINVQLSDSLEIIETTVDL